MNTLRGALGVTSLAGGLWLATAIPAAAETAAPPVVAIEFSGNERTRERVMRREMALAPGDPAEPDAIERSRQGISDLGLFRQVEITAREAEPGDPEAGTVLDVAVREKRFLLPVPRIDASSDRDRSFGLQLRWNNAFGENHTLNAFVADGRYPADRLRDREQRGRIAYDAPLLVGDWGLAGSLERTERRARLSGSEALFDETLHRAELRVTHDLRDTRPRRGWVAHAGLAYEGQRVSGEDAPAPDGHATAVLVGARHDNRRFHLYSETGRSASLSAEVAQRGWGSDYGYRRIDLGHEEYLALPQGEHHSLYLIARGGWYAGGPGRTNVHDLGGSGTLRGYANDYLEGQRYGYLAAEYLRPLGPNWLRLLVVAEAGFAGGSVDPNARSGGGVHASIGVGLRLRFSWFVNFELEAGVAQPLRRGDGRRFFAGGV
ncbi:MAG: hypothetical protein EA371_08175 [Gammaproteobacteria bacterium]|nr:MAG: hypothetical protein EA371_08175 [Gammaproteobacteria bacterium]